MRNNSTYVGGIGWMKSPAAVMWLLTVIGAALRVGGMFGPLTHDELSAICRLRFDTLADVLTYGVKLGDTHPGGVQVMMWLWAQLTGTSAFAVRLPFVLMGIATMPLVYAIGRRWYGDWAALLPTAVMAVSQYTIYYSDLARPYCAGLFFILCALYVLTLMVTEERYTFLRLALFALFEACCAYTQYFCALTALLMACGALFFVGRRHLLPYLASCLGAVLLFLPHIGITLYQLFELKGIGGWLGAPTPAFGLEYLRYLTHHSWIAAAVAVVAYALLFRPEAVRRNWPLMAASLAVGVLPLVIGYVYSVAVNPVLQFSVLIFSFPFLLLALAGGVIDSPLGWRTAAVTGVYVVTMVTTLFVTRRHYTMLQKEYIEATATAAQEAVGQYGADNVACLFNIRADKVAYYDSTLHPIPYEVLNDAAQLDSVLAASASPYLLCSGIQDPAMLCRIQRHYPVLLQVRPCVVSEICLFGRVPSPEAINLDSLSAVTVERRMGFFDGEFRDILDTSLADLTASRFACIEATLQFRQIDTAGEPLHLVMELVRGSRRLSWNEEVTPATLADSLGTIVLPIRVESIVKHRSQLRHTRLKIYLWNPGGNTVTQPLSCRVRVFPTSPWMYSVLEEI